MTDLRLAGKRALVTGASAGIGRGIATALAAEGVQLAIQARRTELLESLADEIVADGGSRPTIITADLYEDGVATRIVDEANAGLGGIDIVVNNAGQSRAFTLDTPDELWQEALNLSFTRPRQIATLAIPGMQASGWGRIINITGKSESIVLNGAVAAKAAMHAWSKTLSRLVGPDGITVHCVAPGKIFSEQIMRNYTEEFRTTQAAQDIPVRRYGQPSDMANVVTFLVSPNADYLTGLVINVDGGLKRFFY